MNDQERKIISDIFARLEQTANQPREPEAERFIAEKVRAQPYAPYAMAQAIYVQEEAMKSLNGQLEQLKAENEELRRKGSGGGIFSSLFGGGGREQPRAPQPGYAPQTAGYGGQPGYGQQQPGYGQQAGGPWGGQPQGGPWAGAQQPAQGGGFLRSALTTAAGVAGGMVVGNALMNAFSGGSHSTLGSLSSTDMASMGFGDSAGSGAFSNASLDDGGSYGDQATLQDAGFGGGGGGWDSGGSIQDASFDDGGSDFGGGDGGSWE